MIKVRQAGVFFIVLALSLLMFSTVSLAQDPDTGKVVWEEQASCKQCHGVNGEGVWGATLAGNDKDAEAWIAQVRNPRRAMPTYSEDQVSDQMIIDMHAYLTSLEAPAEPGFQNPDLAEDAHEGQVLIVQKRCVACHGLTGPVKNFEQRGETPTAEAVVAQLRSPKQWMPSFSEAQVSDEEAALIADFVASQIAPTSLPQSGSETDTNPVLILLMLGGLFFIGGFTLHKVKTRI